MKKSKRNKAKPFLTFADLKVGEWYIQWVSYKYPHVLMVKVEKDPKRKVGKDCNNYCLSNGSYGLACESDKVVRINEPAREYCRRPFLRTSNEHLGEILKSVGR